MSCKKWNRKIIDALAGELDDRAGVGLHQHLAECAACRREELRLREILAAAAPRDEWVSVAALEERLAGEMARLGAAASDPACAPPRRAAAPARLRLIPAWAAAAIVLLAAGSGFWLGLKQARPSPADATPSVGSRAAEPRAPRTHRAEPAPADLTAQVSAPAGPAPGEARFGPTGPRFVVVPADAMMQRQRSRPDSL